MVIGPRLAQVSGEANCVKLRSDNWRMPIFTMTQIDARITELVARLTALERERAEIDTLRSVG